MIAKIELKKNMLFSDGRVRSNLNQITEKLNELIDWVNKEEEYRSKDSELTKVELKK